MSSFFARQQQARRNSKLLVALFLLTVVAIIVVINAVVLAIAGVSHDPYSGEVAMQWDANLLRQNLALIGWTTLGVGGLIGLATLYRVSTLSSGGGGEVARLLGGTRVDAESADPSLRRLYNVVEEMALASGIPVPEVYVLEQESGINAFAAGFSTSDAAVAVTRGALDGLSRDELQGVIAHEFSHVFNGDMRLNMRLMGVLFGILVIALIGRILMRVGVMSGRGSSRNGGGAAAGLMFGGLVVMAVGYIGLLGANLIKAAVSRQREYLADASAVQFTRFPDGIAGALKKIGGYEQGSRLQTAEVEEVSHMLFANGLSGSAFAGLLATHPPLERRIRAIDPRFDPADYARAEQDRAAAASRIGAAAAGFAGAGAAAVPVADEFAIQPSEVVAAVGQLDERRLLDAASLHAAIPPPLLETAHSPERATLLICALLLNDDAQWHGPQLALIGEQLGDAAVAEVSRLHAELAELGLRFRLPLFDIAFPALRHQSVEVSQRLRTLAARLIEVDGKVDIYEYALSRLLERQLEEAGRPGARRPSELRLIDCTADLDALFALMGRVGHASERGARDACQRGLAQLLPASPFTCAAPDGWDEPWPQVLDRALARLDRLPFTIKEGLVEALVATVLHNGRVNLREAELLRTVCALLHCPLPLFPGNQPAA